MSAKEAEKFEKMEHFDCLYFFMIKLYTAVHLYPFLLKTRAFLFFFLFLVDWPSVHSLEASGGYDFKSTGNF